MRQVTTKDKLEFVHAMARHSDANVWHCQRLMRLGATFGTLKELACNRELTVKESAKMRNVGQSIVAVCQMFKARVHFQSDPRGNTVKIMVSDGYTNDWGREGICVPTS